MSKNKCWHYDAIDNKAKDNCINCIHWNNKKERCKDEQLLIDRYKESKSFEAYDYMMKQNKGIRIDD